MPVHRTPTARRQPFLQLDRTPRVGRQAPQLARGRCFVLNRTNQATGTTETQEGPILSPGTQIRSIDIATNAASTGIFVFLRFVPDGASAEDGSDDLLGAWNNDDRGFSLHDGKVQISPDYTVLHPGRVVLITTNISGSAKYTRCVVCVSGPRLVHTVN